VNLRAIAGVLPLVVFFWQVVGASAAFSPVSRGSGSGLISGLISLGFVGLIVGSDASSPHTWLIAAGVLGLIGALALFEWARRSIRGRFFSYVFSSDTPSFLHTRGPFAYVRNPFYTSYLLSMASTALMRPALHRWLIVIAAVVYFHIAAMFEERKFAGSAVAQEYEEYKRRTGRFVPKVFQRSG